MKWIKNIPKFRYQDDLGLFKKSAWTGHFFFAYDLVRNLKPQIIVELGSHYGHSFFSMAEAVFDEKYAAKLYPVDTWKGDKHAGFYDNDVYVRFNLIVDKYFDQLQINPLRMTFNKALDKFADQSIDLLHIDGLHTYEDVKEDFDNWLPKLKKEGIILMHDIVEMKDDFGVYKLWEEIKQKYHTIDFVHSHGLGVVILSNNVWQQIKGFVDDFKLYYPAIAETNNQKYFYQYKCEDLETRVKKLQTDKINLNNKIKDLRKEINQISEQRNQATQQLSSIFNSRAWKSMQIMLKPIRFIKKLLGRS